MKLALAGLAGSGKTTLFSALSIRRQTSSQGREESNLALLSIPDEHVEKLSAIYQPKKFSFAVITYVDPAPPVVKADDPSTRLPNELKQADGLLEVIRNFDAGMGPPQPASDHQAFLDELILNDLITLENRLARIAHDKK